SGSSTAPAYVLRAVESRETDVDVEPNDDVPLPIDPVSLSARGRLAAPGDRDRYTFEVTPAMAATLTTIDLTWPGAETRSLCLRSDSGGTLQCADGVGAVVLSS